MVWRILVVLHLALVAGCVGRYTNPLDGGADGVPAADGPVGDRDGPVGPTDIPHGDAGCSPAGTPAECDPVLVTGCSSGACYVTVAGIVCVCPAGTNATGTACGTTVECAPGNVCAGTAAPGLCRKTCDPLAPQCNSDETCTTIKGYAQVGYCQPN